MEIILTTCQLCRRFPTRFFLRPLNTALRFPTRRDDSLITSLMDLVFIAVEVAPILSYKMRAFQPLTQTFFVQCSTNQHRLKTL